MNPTLVAYGWLAAAIIAEVTGSAMLQKSAQFTRLWPTVAMGACFVTSLFCLSMALRGIPLGVAYAIWAGVGIVLTTAVSVVVFGFGLDGWAVVGIGLIIAGVLVLNLLSQSVAH